jgi:hypothetical protein
VRNLGVFQGGIVLLLSGSGCGGPGDSDPFAGDGSEGVDTSTGSSTRAESTAGPGAAADGAAADEGATADDDGEGPKLDLAIPDAGPFDPPDPTCEVVDEMDGVASCDEVAPPDAFDPDVQWSWDGGPSMVTPLVANLTDDNDDGTIDLCDIPDIVVVTTGLGGTIHVLDGATGFHHFAIPTLVNGFVTPAIGDIDGDGLPEIVAATFGLGAISFIAFEHDGAVKWTSDPVWEQDNGGAVALADLDNDGSPEIIADGAVLAADGSVRFVAPAQEGWIFLQRSTATIAADLDDDGDLEIVLGQSAYHHDGTEVYRDPSVLPGYPQIADLDADDDPEIIVNNDAGITVLEHDGSVKVQDMRPTGDPAGFGRWFRPSTVHDFDGDEVSEFAVSSAASYSVYEPNLTVSWTADVQDASGWAAGTAFDFLGDGGAEAMYADEATLFVFDDLGGVLMQVPRSSRTIIEYPVVADVDNDGSAEIVVVSALDFDDNQTAPTVQVIRDVRDRWIQARRIWNQHTYHVTNVREDGTIPTFEPPSWKLLNTYRTNAQIENGSVCKPPPAG